MRSLACGASALIQSNEIIIYFATTDSFADQFYARLEAALSVRDRDRASSFIFERDRRLFVLAHALLDRAISLTLGHDAWRIRTGSRGKPELVDQQCKLNFSLSHSGKLAVCAIASKHKVGIDAEILNRAVACEGVASDCFGESEQKQLRACDPAKTTDLFFRLWTLKEATLKALGTGLLESPKDVQFKLDPILPSFSPHFGEEPRWWHYVEFVPIANHRVALAVRRPPDSSISVTLTPMSFTTQDFTEQCTPPHAPSPRGAVHVGGVPSL
jgi:4'-phosphopantetheinyl transferase